MHMGKKPVKAETSKTPPEPEKETKPSNLAAVNETKPANPAATEETKQPTPAATKGTSPGKDKDEKQEMRAPARPRQNFLKPVAAKVVFVFHELKNTESIWFLLIAITTIAISISVAFIAGQLSFTALELNFASIAGHLYGIITSSIAFFFFARYLRMKKDVVYVRTFLVLFFIIYFLIVFVIGLFLAITNIIYLTSTIGNAFILFSAYTLIIFILNPEILGITGRNANALFSSGKHVRVIIVYLSIALMQIFGFALLNFAINVDGGGTAFSPDNRSLLDFFYLSTITFATIGYGDIHPVMPAAELSCIIQAILSHIISLLFLAVLLLYLSSASSSTTEGKREA